MFGVRLGFKGLALWHGMFQKRGAAFVNIRRAYKSARLLPALHTHCTCLATGRHTHCTITAQDCIRTAPALRIHVKKGLKGVEIRLNAKDKASTHRVPSVAGSGAAPRHPASAHLYIGKPMCAIACKQAIKNPAHGRGSVCSICGFIATCKTSISSVRWSPAKRQPCPVVWLLCYVITNNQVLVGFFLLA